MTDTQPPPIATLNVLAVLSQKGGAGKTTLSCALAALAERAGITTIVYDLDPQASAMRWHDLREASTGNEKPLVFCVPPSRVDKLLNDHGNAGAELVIIDTPPHSGADALTVAQLARHILVPVQPSLPDLSAITSTLQIARTAQRPATVILNRARVNHRSIDEARAILTGSHATIAPVVMHHRIAHSTSYITGQCAAETEPTGKAAAELNELFDWLRTSGSIPRADGRAA